MLSLQKGYDPCPELEELVGARILDVGFHPRSNEGGFTIYYEKDGKKKALVLGFTELGSWLEYHGDLGGGRRGKRRKSDWLWRRLLISHCPHRRKCRLNGTLGCEYSVESEDCRLFKKTSAQDQDSDQKTPKPQPAMGQPLRRKRTRCKIGQATGLEGSA